MSTTQAASAIEAKDRVIFALDVPNKKEAFRLIDELGDRLSFYKVGLELLMSGGIDELLTVLVRDGKKVFVDLKLPSDIPETVRRAVSVAADLGVTFLTLSSTVMDATIQTAKEARGDRPGPKLLFVSFLSSLSREDYEQLYGRPGTTFERFLIERTHAARKAGADGFIVSGEQIQLLRQEFGPGVVLVSPGIRPAWASADDHKRMCTPAEAIRWGADYIVVGRPIKNAPNRREAAQRVIDELAQELSRLPSTPAR
jgi:orotidine-5'-phosphate decarboxylase